MKIHSESDLLKATPHIKFHFQVVLPHNNRKQCLMVWKLVLGCFKCWGRYEEAVSVPVPVDIGPDRHNSGGMHDPDALAVTAWYSPAALESSTATWDAFVVAFDGATAFNVTLAGGHLPRGVNASSRLMKDTNFGGHNLPNVSGAGCAPAAAWPAATSTALDCQAVCDGHARCDMWTFVPHLTVNASQVRPLTGMFHSNCRPHV